MKTPPVDKVKVILDRLNSAGLPLASGRGLVVCESTVAIVHHLRLDDGTRKMGGGLDMHAVALCKPGAGPSKLNGWDLKTPPPKSPERAIEENLHLPTGMRWCSECIVAWRKL